MSDIGIGLHRDLDFATYAAIRAVNSGVVSKWWDVSPLHVHEALNGRIENDDTKDRKFGRAHHCRMLEPERFKAEILISTKCCAILGSGNNKGKRCSSAGSWFDGANWFCGTHRQSDCNQPADYIDEGEAERIEAMAERLHNHPALGLFKRKGWSELSGVFDRNGTLCKFRSDRVPEEMDLIIDIKKTQLGEATDRHCLKAIENNGYFIQAAMNVDGIRAHHPLGLEPRFVWVFIEDKHPHGVNVILASHQMIDDGRTVIDLCLTDYQRCQKLGKFPDYMPDGLRPFEASLSDWKHRQIQERKAALLA